MRTIESMFADYAEHHKTLGNKVFHRLGIPMIMFSLLGLLAKVGIDTTSPVPLDLGVALIATAGIFYLVLEWRLAIAMIVISALLYLGARPLPVTVLWALFVAGWIFQFIGHSVYEKRQPAFFNNLVHLLVGPLWILNDVIPIVRPARADNVASK
ncbi:MAG: DUF962 domain-containing protein [Acidobacteria bacterium]|nr:DUF962 domain-containing protein [Acidobacteriota bacterium]